MSEFHEKKELTEKIPEKEVEIIEPRTGVLDAAINEKPTSRKVIDSETHEVLEPINYGKFIIEPVISFINGLLEKDPDLTAIDEKQCSNLKRDFEKMINGFGKDNPIMKAISKIAKKRPYIPFIITGSGILAQKSFEKGKAKKRRG